MRSVPLALAASVLCLIVLCLIAPTPALAQGAQTAAPAAVPRVITLTGVFQPADGQPPRDVETVTLALYAEPTGGVPLWQETQNVAVDATGRYALLLGAMSADGIPREVLTAGARWLGTTFDRPGEVERPRVQLTSVPYTLRAADAETLGGRPASAYLLAPSAATGEDPTTAGATGPLTTTAAGLAPSAPAPQALQSGTVNFLAKYFTTADVGSSTVFESNGLVGIGTAAPFDSLHVRFNNTNGVVTGYAVQNLGNTAASYSGMLFYDQNNQLAQFQGFNNVTHEYRINNIASNASINFMTGSLSRFLVSPSGTIGIGTNFPSPTANLEVSNAVSGSGTTNINVTTHSANAFGPVLIGRKARGTESAPTAVLNNDALLNLTAHGYGAAGFVSSASISMRTSENWTPTAQGSIINFSTTANGTTVPNTRMTIGPNGNVGIGVFFAQAGLEVSNANGVAGAGEIFTTTFTNAGASRFVGRRARGTGIAPTAVQNGDFLVGYEGAGYGTTGFSQTRGGMFVRAAENWTDAAQGTRLVFSTTATGTNTFPADRMTITAAGDVGIGTTVPGMPLEVSRTGTNVGVASTLYTNGANVGSFLVAQSARGTSAAPLALQAGDFLGALLFSGYGTTFFGEAAAVGAFAAENFSDTARGTVLGFATAPLGGNDAELVMALLPSGNVGIGTPFDVNGLPTATDRLQVFGDARVGNAGTNGCLKRFDGNFLVGSCASDRRFKKNITPFGPVLDRLTGLQPVHYHWRAAEFPERHFGEAQAYGLVAQDVEQVLPELVATDGDGYKAVDYSKLPLLTLQAVKELKAENDALKQRVAELDPLKQRVAELERLLTDLVAKQR
jgi:hypothetical protein